MRVDIEYNGSTGLEHGVLVRNAITVPVPQKRYTSYEIPGRDGSLIESDDTYEDIEIPVTLNFKSPRENWMEAYRGVKDWLLSDAGDKTLKMSDDEEFFYKVKMVELKTPERLVKRIGVISVVFVCDPYTYVGAGQLWYQKEDVSYNAFQLSHPVYHIQGEGVCSLTVNGQKMSANVGQNLLIDTDLKIAYRDDGALMNSSVEGFYSDLFLHAGENEIDITDGFVLKVKPNWRCK